MSNQTYFWALAGDVALLVTVVASAAAAATTAETTASAATASAESAAASASETAAATATATEPAPAAAATPAALAAAVPVPGGLGSIHLDLLSVDGDAVQLGDGLSQRGHFQFDGFFPCILTASDPISYFLKILSFVTWFALHFQRPYYVYYKMY